MKKLLKRQQFMQQIQNLDAILEIIGTGEPVLIYFSGEHCSVCHDLKPKVEKELSTHFPQIKLFEVNATLHKQIASHFTVFSIPTMLLFFDGREFQRVGRNISLHAFMEDIRRPYMLFCD